MFVLFQAPHCLQEENLDSALERACQSPLEEARSNAELTSSHITTLKELGGLIRQGRDLYQDVKAVSDVVAVAIVVWQNKKMKYGISNFMLLLFGQLVLSSSLLLNYPIQCILN